MPETVWDDSEIYLAVGRGEALIDTGGADDVLEALAKRSPGPPKTFLEAEHGLHDKLVWDAEVACERKGLPPVAAVPPTPNRNVVTPAPVEGAPVPNDGPVPQGAPDVSTPTEDLIVLETTGQGPHPLVNPKVPGIYHIARLNPLGAEEVVDLIDPPPATADDYADLVRRTLTNGPMPLQPEPSARPFARKPSKAGEPVDLATGAFVVELCDMAVPSPHIPIALTRFYRSGPPYFGPFGYGWDHSFNIYLRPLEAGAFALWTGQLREVHFVVDGPGLQPQPGFAARLEPLPGVADVYDVVFSGGLTWRFERPAGWTHPERIPLTAITDRHHNAVRLTYNTMNAVASALDAVGRGLFFGYGSCALLESVTDHTGSRIVRYQHDPEIEHLVRVVLPATAQYPDGVPTTYDYDVFNPHPAMRHNLLRIHDANDRVTVENFYAGPEAGWSFNTVVSQRTAGFRYQFEYQQIQYVWPDASNADVLATRTLVRPPDGSLHTYTFNYRGDLLDHRLRLNRDRSYRVIARQWTHDAQGNLAESVEPDGLRTLYTFDADNPDPCARHNLLRVERISPLPGIVASRIVFQGRYDPVYQLILETKDEANAQTRYRYDFDVAPASATGRLMQMLPPQVVLADGTPQQSVFNYEHDAKGQLTASITPEGVRTEIARFTGDARADLPASITVDPGGAHLLTALDHAPTGFGLSVTLPGARTTRLRYNALGQLEETLAPEVDGASAALRQWFDDSGAVLRVEREAGSYGGLPAGASIVDLFERNEVGQLRGVVMGDNTVDRRAWRQCLDHEGRAVSLHDPLGNRTERCFGETGLLLRETAGAGTPDARTTSYAYDRAGRVVRIVQPSGAQTIIEHDVWGRPHKITQPSKLVRFLAFGVNDTVVEERAEDLSSGTPVLLQRQQFEYDRRGRLVAATVFSFDNNPAAAVPLTTRYHYDRDDRLRVLQTPRGARHAFGYDTAGRPLEETDFHGNVRRFGYDAAGDLVAITLIDAPGGVPRTRTSRFVYDARGRLVGTTFLDAVTAFGYDARDLAVMQRMSNGVTQAVEFNAHGQMTASVVDPLGMALRSSWDFDAAGRPLRYVDPMARVTAWARDPSGLSTVCTPPDGTVWTSVADKTGLSSREDSPAGNRIVRQRLDASGRALRVTATPGSGQQPVPPLDYVFDALGRLVKAAAGSEVIERRHDSMDRVVSEFARGRTVTVTYDDIAGSEDLIYPDGRCERTLHNAAGQPTQVELVTPGALGGTAGDVLLKIGYAPTGLPATLRYGNGVTAALARDDHDRVHRIDYRSGGTLLASCRLRHDELGHRAVVQYLGSAAHNLVHAFDARDRLIEARSGFALPPLPDAATPAAQAADIAAARAAAATAPGQRFNLDDADARRQVLGVNGGAPTLSYGLGPDHRVVSAGAEALTYSLDGQRIEDAQFRYELDAFNRVTALRDSVTHALVAELRYDALARVSAGAVNGVSFERWFAGAARIQELSGAGVGGVDTQHSAHPLWAAPFTVVDAAGPSYIHHDQGGSSLCVTDAGGAVIERHRYDTFGANSVFADDGVTPLPARKSDAWWRGMPSLGTTPLYRTPHRLYDARLGVFTSRDPLLYADSPSPYAYAAHNPVDYADPSGLAKTPLGPSSAPPGTVDRPSLGDRILDGLGQLPGSPLGIRNDVKTGLAMVDAFKAEKGVGAGLAMAANVLNPLYHAEVSRFQAGEAADRGHTGEAVEHGIHAVLGYVQTLSMAAGLARGAVKLGAAPVMSPVTPPVRALTAPPAGGFSVTVAEGRPVVRLPALNVEMNTAARGLSEAVTQELPEAVRGGKTQAIAAGVPVVSSGFGYPGYEGNLAVEVFEHARNNGIELRPNGFYDRLPNLGAPGAWASTHAELKVVFRNVHVQFVEVNRAMCKGCRGSISQIVMQRGMPIVVLDPKGFWYFLPELIEFPVP